MSSENVEVVRLAFEAYGRRDVPAMLEFMHPEIEARPGLVGGLEGTVYRGRDGYKQFLEDVDATWADFRIELREIRDLGDTVVALGHTWGEGREGIAVDAPGGWVLGMRDGQIHRFRSFNTWEETLEAVELHD
jgi:uncharacterized protein